MHKHILASIVLAVLATQALAADPASESFVKKAIQGNSAEVRLGQLAEKNGESPKIKQYGAMLAKDHGNANAEAEKLAKTLNVQVPSAPNDKQKKTYEELAAMRGAAFDKAFAKHMVEDHQKDIDSYTKAAKSKDKAVADYANSILPTLKKHLEQAKGLPGGAS